MRFEFHHPLLNFWDKRVIVIEFAVSDAIAGTIDVPFVLEESISYAIHFHRAITLLQFFAR